MPFFKADLLTEFVPGLQAGQNRPEQCFAAHIVQCCHQYCSELLNLLAGGTPQEQRTF